ncbi:thymidylate synthase [uncultured Halovibrio sp.]|uniref:thymidylate synthase n=1 Tax=uncultured Halovibrio sp. TaxID=985049 RepID=UPI003414ABD0
MIIWASWVGVSHDRLCIKIFAQAHIGGSAHPPTLIVQKFSRIIAMGVPFNIASYSLLTCMMAQQAGLEPGDFVHTFGDVHLYQNHLTDEIVYEQLRRTPGPLPELALRRCPSSLFEYREEDFRITGYDPYPVIRAPIAI